MIAFSQLALYSFALLCAKAMKLVLGIFEGTTHVPLKAPTGLLAGATPSCSSRRLVWKVLEKGAWEMRCVARVGREVAKVRKVEDSLDAIVLVGCGELRLRCDCFESGLMRWWCF